MSDVKFVVKVGEGEKAKEIELTEEVLRTVYEYLHAEMSLERLAEKLGLEGWEEAYEFIKKIPAWLAWTPPTLLRYRLKWIAQKVKEGKLKIQ